MSAVTYEERLGGGVDLAIREASRHFEYDSAVHKTLRRVCSKLNEIGVPYAVMGAMALFAHGLRRFTEYVDILTTQGGVEGIRRELVGLGYRPVHQSSRHIRDTETGVRIEFLVAGQFPGDGKEKPVAFPDPATCGEPIDGIRFVNLTKLVELKLASGTVAHRMKDLADVQELIKTLRLPRELGDQIDPSVRGKYHELWDALASAPPDPYDQL